MQPSRRSGSDWPYNDATIYNASGSAWLEEPLGFSDFLQLTQELDADPYVVLNYDSANKPDDGKSATLDQVLLVPLC